MKAVNVKKLAQIHIYVWTYTGHKKYVCICGYINFECENA